jgi:hypothetical protein
MKQITLTEQDLHDLIEECVTHRPEQNIYKAGLKLGFEMLIKRCEPVIEIFPNAVVSGSLPTDEEIQDAHSKMINVSKSVGFVNGAKWMRDKIKVGNDR